MRILFLLLFLVFWSGVLLGQNVNIPDEKFLDALIMLRVDTDDDSTISVAEAEAVLSLDVSQKEIVDLTGIEAFVNMDNLSCQMNGLTELNLSSCIQLKNLNCGYNNLVTLDLSSNVKLEALDCQNNQIESVDVTKCANLQYLKCPLNHLTSLDVSGNPNLNDLECYNNNITELDLSGNIFLEELACVSNHLSTLDLSNNLLLNDLNCADNDLTILELSNNNAIQFMHCEKNELADLDLSGCSSLIGLECQGNKLGSLNVKNNVALTYLDCQSNLLTDLDISNNELLLFLGCGGNQLDVLDFSANVALKTIDCSSNQLTKLDLTANTVLTELRCYDNNLAYLDISNQTLIERMDASANQLLTIDLSNFKGCDWFTCISLQDMPTLQQVCITDINFSYLISITGSPNAIFTTECRDVVAPVLTVEELIEDKDSVMVICSEEGIVYMVPENTEMDLELIRQAAIDSLEVYAEIPANMAVLTYPNGFYWFYARDTTGNLSEHSSMTIQWVGVENEFSRQIRIFPNPVSDQLSVLCPESTSLAIEIVSPNGQTIYRGVTDDASYNIDFSGFESGIYIIKIRSGSNFVVRKLIRQ
ncbi:MAG: T9SS type A sorting domain-containing protein [Bacteroidetes bacterium]|nr:T9SS type A sorting domain-containing protein [Bacteroidota bacterium]